MRRKHWFWSLVGIAGLAVVGAVGLSALTSAEPRKSDPPEVAAASRSTPQLPITGCALFSSGVGYFERTGEIEGNVAHSCRPRGRVAASFRWWGQYAPGRTKRGTRRERQEERRAI